MTSAYPLVVAVLLGAIGLALLNALRSKTRHGRLPPGPKPLPFLGNLLDLPKEHPWVTYRDWAAKYGKQDCCCTILLLTISSNQAIPSAFGCREAKL